MKFEIDIESISVILQERQSDIVVIHTTMPTACPEMKDPVSFTIRARKGYGEQWVKDNFPSIPCIIRRG